MAMLKTVLKTEDMTVLLLAVAREKIILVALVVMEKREATIRVVNDDILKWKRILRKR